MANWKRTAFSLVDSFRAAAEYNYLLRKWPDLYESAKPSDGQPVLVIPGFSGNDLSSLPLRSALAAKGYKPYGWDCGTNTGLRSDIADNLARRLRDIYKRNGNRKVSLIGHSLGGLYARALAQEFPDMVSNVITVGSPFNIKDGASKWLTTVVKMLSDKRFVLASEDTAERLLTPPDVPTTSIFSKTDGVVNWENCLNPPTDHSENIEVSSSHLGMIWNKEIVGIIFDRLAAAGASRWTPYRRPARDAGPANPDWHPPVETRAKGKSKPWRFFPAV